jgi:hypothetical protein
MLPAIKRLEMNDFTDDSAVKFYLNRRLPNDPDDSFEGDFTNDETLIATEQSMATTESDPYLIVASPAVERFTSPSYRFVMQLVIYPQDLPDDMVFDTNTEAIVFKNTLSPRLRNPATSGVNQQMRKKIFVFPRNVTVVEVIELGLERFGILEGVVDGGDEVEDKVSKRSSVGRVRYNLAVQIPGFGQGQANHPQERELSMSSRVIEAFPASRPPPMKSIEKRRSIDSAQLLGNVEDVGPDDPVFVLRRAKQYKPTTATTKHGHRLSAPLDELALANFHKEHASVRDSGSDVSSYSQNTNLTPTQNQSLAQAQGQSRRELIEAQRADQRSNQRLAILSAQTNSLRGVDVVLPGNAVLRSSRYEVDDRMRYSYVDVDGETYDVSEIVEEEWTPTRATISGGGSSGGSKGDKDLLEGVLSGAAGRGGNVDEKLDRVLSKIKSGRQQGVVQPVAAVQNIGQRAMSPSSEYGSDEGTAEVPGTRARSTTPSSRNNAAGLSRGNSAQAQAQALTQSQLGRASPAPGPDGIARTRADSSAGRFTPLGNAGGPGGPIVPRPVNRTRNPSVASVATDASGYATPATHPPTERSESAFSTASTLGGFGAGRSADSRSATPTAVPGTTGGMGSGSGAHKRTLSAKQKKAIENDFGFNEMMAIIELRAHSMSLSSPTMKTSARGGAGGFGALEPLHPADELLFGREMDLERLHPSVREIYSGSFKMMEDMDKVCRLLAILSSD